MRDVIFTIVTRKWLEITSTYFSKREQLAVPKIGQYARLSLTVFELQMYKNNITYIVPVHG